MLSEAKRSRSQFSFESDFGTGTPGCDPAPSAKSRTSGGGEENAQRPISKAEKRFTESINRAIDRRSTESLDNLGITTKKERDTA
jgi:hypothetical protein